MTNLIPRTPPTSAPTWIPTSTHLPTPTPRRLRRHQLLVDSAYLASGFPLALVSFSVLVSLLAVGASLLITLVGLPILVLTCWSAGLFAALERQRLTRLDHTSAVAPTYLRPRRGIAGLFDVLRDGQRWRDLLHGLLSLPVSCFTWSVGVAWSGIALFALSWPLFGHALGAADDRHSRDVPEFIGIHSYAGRSVCYVAVGAFCLVTLPFVLRGLAAAQAAFGRALLLASRRPA